MPKCPHCNQELTPQEVASLMGRLGKGKTSERKEKSSAANGKLGGRPKKEEKDKAPA